MVRRHSIVFALLLVGCSGSTSPPEAQTKAFLQQTVMSQQTTFDIQGTVSHEVGTVQSKFEFAAEVQATAKQAGFAVDNSSALLRISGATLASHSGERGQISGEDVNTYTLGKSGSSGLGKAGPSRYVITNFSNAIDLQLEILTSRSAGKKDTLAPGKACDMIKNSAGDWEFTPPRPIDLNEAIVARLQKLRDKLN